MLSSIHQAILFLQNDRQNSLLKSVCVDSKSINKSIYHAYFCLNDFNEKIKIKFQPSVCIATYVVLILLIISFRSLPFHVR